MAEKVVIIAIDRVAVYGDTVARFDDYVVRACVLRTEKKAQKRAYEIMKEEGLATAEELESCKKLFKLYNIEYVNNMVIALLELIYRVLQIIAYVRNASSSSSK